jgi:hypothetical protein
VTAGVRDRARTIRVDGRIGSGTIVVRRRSAASSVVTFILVIAVPVLGALIFTTPHAYVASNANTAALLRDHTAQRGAFAKTRELLRREDGKGR